MKYKLQGQHGFAAIAAIFLVVVLAGLGSFMVTLSNAQQLNFAQDLEGSRAYWAARAGLEWSLVAIPATPALCTNAAPTLVTGPGPIDGFTVQIRCSQNVYFEGGIPRTIFRIEAQASSSAGVGSLGYVERSLSAALEA